MTTWKSVDRPESMRLGPFGWAVALLRIAYLVPCILFGLLSHVALRWVEKALYGSCRPWTPHVTRLVCRMALFVIGLRVDVIGGSMRGRGAIVANHASWLDIFVLNAADCVVFVSKEEVANWPGIGSLARATGTIFIRRDRRDTLVQQEVLGARLSRRERLVIFPEGTSTDGRRVLPFKTPLFQPFLADDAPMGLRLQPVSLFYCAPEGADPRFYGWWGEMAFGPHLLAVLGRPYQGRVRLIRHDPIDVTAGEDRKSLARRCETAVRSGFECCLKAGSENT